MRIGTGKGMKGEVEKRSCHRNFQFRENGHMSVFLLTLVSHMSGKKERDSTAQGSKILDKAYP